MWLTVLTIDKWHLGLWAVYELACEAPYSRRIVALCRNRETARLMIAGAWAK